MSDPGSSVTEILAELHEVLEASGDLSEDVRQELREAAEDIRQALDPADEREMSVSLRDRLSAALEDFEESHPRLTGIVGRIADALSDMGI
jgi:ElaB/YqjD/DUF883 family membrane-anchored ribosome-binding protein